jgi:hypothetical protein
MGISDEVVHDIDHRRQCIEVGRISGPALCKHPDFTARSADQRVELPVGKKWLVDRSEKAPLDQFVVS